MATVIDSYSESNQDAAGQLASDQNIAFGQGFTAVATYTELDSAKFYLVKSGSPTGNIYCRIYASNGTYGTNALPGTALAQSDAVDASTVTAGYTLITFNFSSDRYVFTPDSKYIACVEYSGGGASSYIAVGRDNSSPSHGGNYVYYPVGGSWTADANKDLIFYVYGIGHSASPSTSPSASASPSSSPSNSPSASPSVSVSPSRSPSESPSVSPSNSVSASPTGSASESPSKSPSASPSASESPSKSPSASPSASVSPSESPSKSPSSSPSTSPSVSPSLSPSPSPATWTRQTKNTSSWTNKATSYS